MIKDKLKFIKKSASFLLILVLLVVIINAVYEKIILPKKLVYIQEKIYEDYIGNLSTKEIDFAFFGDSHLLNVVDPRIIPNSFNFGVAGESYAETYYKLRKILYRDKIKINNAIFEIDWNTFSDYQIEEQNLLANPHLYRNFMSIKEMRQIKNESIIKLFLQTYLPFIGNGERISIFFGERPKHEFYLGWYLNRGNFSSTDKLAEARKHYIETSKGRARINRLMVEYFIKTIELAKENNINILFIKYPMSAEMDQVLREEFSHFTNEDYYKIIFKEINSTHQDYIVLDYYDLFFIKSDYFADPNHLNYIGAGIFTKKVYKDLQKYS